MTTFLNRKKFHFKKNNNEFIFIDDYAIPKGTDLFFLLTSTFFIKFCLIFIKLF